MLATKPIGFLSAPARTACVHAGQSANQRLEDIPLDNLKTEKHNVRRHDIGVGIPELAASIKANSLLQPIAAYYAPDRNTYVVLAGQRRLQAYHYLNDNYPDQGYDKIKCIVFDEPTSDEKKISISLAENITQLAMSSVDLVKAVTDLYDQYGNYQMVQEQFGLTKHIVDKYVRLSRLPSEIQKAIKDNKIHHSPKTAENCALRAVNATKYTDGGPTPVALVIQIATALAHREIATSDIPVGPVSMPVKKPKSKMQINLSSDTASKLKRVAEDKGEHESLLAVEYVASGVDRDYAQLE